MPENRLDFQSADLKRRVLVIEDEPVNREILGFLIEDNYDVVYAETGAEALSVIDEQHDRLSLVLLDLNLPDIKGIDILHRIKGDARTSKLPVIVMTADSDAEVECLSLGAIDFIPKPYPKREVILARMRRTIELYEDRDIISSTERDQLTGLYNREFFYRYVEQYDLHHQDTATDAALLNVNHFHILNERYGRTRGDEVLKQIAKTLQEEIEENGGLACRREADTFLIYCPHRENYDDILEKVSESVGEDSQIRIRLGVYSDTDYSLHVEQRYDRAKLAADTVRNSYSESVGYYDDSMHDKELFAERLIEDFHNAVREGQFSVHFQPKFDVTGREPVLDSAEALVRWRHPEFGMISPGVFIPLFEENGQITELDTFVWKETASQIKHWKETLGRTIPVSVNVSRIDLYDPDLLDTLEKTVGEYGLTRNELLLEITESAYTENSDHIISVVSRLQESGFHIEMDDFGTGYSSLNMLTALPIDVLKLDMQFIRSAFRERKDTRLLEAIIGLAKSMDLPTIAEGVETAEQMFTLKSMGCDVIQGYYFSKPLPAEEFEEYVRGLSAGDTVSLDESDAVSGSIGIRDQFTYEALHDSLTGLYNHSAFNILFQDSDKDHITVMVASVDGYDRIKKERGRDYADRVSKRVAEVLRGSFRSADDICRLQEDEYVIIMSRMNGSMQDIVLNMVEQINSILRDNGEDMEPVSLSVGIAFSDRENPQGDVFADADSALKKMKQIRETGCAVY